MNHFTDIITKYRFGELNKKERVKFINSMNINIQMRKEYDFQEKIDFVMKNSLLLESIENDPDLINSETLAIKDIASYLTEGRTSKRDNDIFDIDSEFELQKKVSKAEIELSMSEISDISAGWVKDFERSKFRINNEAASQQIVEYVKAADPFNEKIIQMPKWYSRITKKIAFQAVAAVLVLSMLLFKSLIPSYSKEMVYDRFYEPMDANSYRMRGSSRDISTKLLEGVDYYLSKDYSRAELTFNELRKMNQNLPEVLLYSGLNQMEQGHFSAAITLLNDLISADDQFIPEAQWYLGLCYIKTGELSKARQLFETLSQTEGIYKRKAQLILKDLK